MQSAPFNAADRFFMTWWVCFSISYLLTSSFVSGSNGICPDIYTICEVEGIVTTGVYGPIALGIP